MPHEVFYAAIHDALVLCIFWEEKIQSILQLEIMTRLLKKI
jgi:hypothetical protein